MTSSLSGGGYDIAFQSLSFRIEQKAGLSKDILSSTTAIVKPNEMCAIMGPSGAGKSTLLNLLAGRISGGTTSGSLLYGGRPSDCYERVPCAYVMQDDVHLATLTVGETLRFAARLRLQGTSEEREARVQHLLSLLRISHCEHTRVGDVDSSGISGGERKRLSIGVEIISLPQILFMDEPTTGLDSEVALEVMESVREITNRTRTTLCTIHQPSPAIFSLFDKLLLMGQGKMVYFGGVQEAVRMFSSPPLSLPATKFPNPADFVLFAASSTTEGLEEITTVYQRSSVWKTVSSEVQHRIDDSCKGRPVFVPAPTPPENRFLTMLHRYAVVVSREKITYMNLISNMFMGFLFGSLYYQPADDTIDGSMSRYAVLFYSLFWSSLSQLHCIGELAMYRHLFERERAAGAYTTFHFHTALFLVEAPQIFLCTLAYCVFIVLLSDLESSFEGLQFLFLMCLLLQICSFSLCQMCASFTKNVAVVFTYIPFILILISVFAGFYIRVSEIPRAIRWIGQISFSAWGLSGLVVNEFEDSDSWCYTDIPLCVSGDEVIDYFDSDINKWSGLGVVLIWVICFQATTVISLLRTTTERGSVYAAPDDAYCIICAPKSDKDEDNLEEGDGLSDPLLQDRDKREADADVDASRGSRSTTDMPDLIFRHISFSVFDRTTRQHKQILHDVSGSVARKEMCALMGSSGAGKTTLLDILAGKRLLVGETYKCHGHGDVLYEGVPLSPNASLNSHRAYVLQDDVHIADLTVEETVHYAAKFRLRGSSEHDVRVRARTVLTLLRLRKVATTRVEDISGGERKRLSIAVEVVAFPPILFLDEPTSGLDSEMALEVMQSVRVLTNRNRTTVCTIHQPSAKIFSLFDKLLLLGKGRVLYLGSAAKAVETLMSPPVGMVVKVMDNPADLVLRAAQGHMTGSSGDFIAPEDLAAAHAKTSVVAVRDLDDVEPRGLLALEGGCTDMGPCWNSVQTLTHRHLVVMFRGGLFRAMIFKQVAAALLFGSLYWDLDHTYRGAENRIAVIFICTFFYASTNMLIIPQLLEERTLLYREEAAGAYNTTMYFVAKSIAMIPQQIIMLLSYVCVLYYMVGLRTDNDGFLYFLLLSMILQIAGFYFNAIFAIVSPTAQIAMVIFTLPLSFVAFFSGFSPRPSEVPVGWSWAPYATFMFWGMKGLVVSEFEGTGVWVDEVTGRAWTDEEILEEYECDSWDRVDSIYTSLGFTAIFMTGMYMVLRYVDHRKS